MLIFISYSHQDTAFVTTLTRDLQSQHFEIWVDNTSIQGGAEWRKSIVDGINACDAFIVVMSPHAVASRNVVKEISMADERKKRIVPVVCAPYQLPAEMEYQLTGVQYIDLSGVQYGPGLNRLIAALTNQPNPKPADPRPSPMAMPLTQQLPGTWQVQIQNPFSGAIGYGQVLFYPNGQFNLTLNTPQGAIQAQGMGQLMGVQFSLQGAYTFTAMPLMSMPYALLMQVTQVGQGLFYAISAAQEQIMFQKVG